MNIRGEEYALLEQLVVLLLDQFEQILDARTARTNKLRRGQCHVSGPFDYAGCMGFMWLTM